MRIDEHPDIGWIKPLTTWHPVRGAALERLSKAAKPFGDACGLGDLEAAVEREVLNLDTKKRERETLLYFIGDGV